jgi:hypothetical protein
VGLRTNMRVVPFGPGFGLASSFVPVCPFDSTSRITGLQLGLGCSLDADVRHSETTVQELVVSRVAYHQLRCMYCGMGNIHRIMNGLVQRTDIKATPILTTLPSCPSRLLDCLMFLKAHLV